MNTENINSDPSSEGKTVHNIGYKSNSLGNLWITWFTPKSSSCLLCQDTGGAVEHSSDCMKLTPRSWNNVNVSSNLKIVEASKHCAKEPLTSSGKELPCATKIEGFIGCNKILVQSDQKSEFKVSPILPSSRLKDSEAIASLFARRLDATKQIVPSGVSGNRTSSTITCFFCGRKGHHLQYCPEITDSEIEDLLSNMKPSNRSEELPCMCIGCYELDHWAVACAAASRGQHHSACRASSANFSELQCCTRVEENKKLLDDNREVITGHTLRIDTRKGHGTLYGVTAAKMRSKTNVKKKYVGSDSEENESKKNQTTPWGNFINQQVSDTRKAIFNAVRMLCLSLTDILKQVDHFHWLMTYGK